MNRLLKFAVAVAFAPLVFASSVQAVSKGELYPSIKTSHRTKGELSKESMQGKVTIINFWATWCAACKVELKEMAHMYKDLEKNPQIKFAFVSLDKDSQAATKYIDATFGKTSLIGKNLYFDSEFALAEKFDLDSFPTTLVVDEMGKIIHVQLGFKEGEGTTKKIGDIALKCAQDHKMAAK